MLRGRIVMNWNSRKQAFQINDPPDSLSQSKVTMVVLQTD